MRITVGRLSALLGAPAPPGLAPDLLLEDVTTDSRDVTPGQLFIGLKGEKFDGADYAAGAIERGAALAVVERRVAEVGERQLLVPDALVALGRIASWWRRELTATIIAVTGSAGKTTTKDLIASVCAEIGPTVATIATENNEIGVPKTLLRLRESDRFGVLEFGMRGRGEIKQLAEIARPDIGVITIIGDAHVGLLGSREAIAQSKAEMLPLLPPTGTAVLNADDFFFPLLRRMCACPVTSFGSAEDAEVRCLEVLEEALEHVHAVVRLAGETIELRVPLPGRHNLMNALAAAAAGLACGATAAQIKAGIESYAGAAMRGNIVAGPNGATVIDDVYNANPTSMAVSLQMLSQAPGRKVLVFGDMKELGAVGPEAHRTVGRQAAEAGVALLVAVGELAALTAAAAADLGVETHLADTPANAAAWLRPRLQAGDIVLVKGSRAMALEGAVKGLVNGE